MNSEKLKIPLPYSGVANLVRGWIFVGTWQPQKNQPKWFIFYQIIMIFVFTAFFEFALIVNFLTIDNIGKSAEVLCTSITELSLLLKMIVVYLTRKKISNLFIMIDKYLVSDSGTKEEIQCINNGIKQSKTLHLMLLYGYMTAAFAAGIGAILVPENTLPIPSWYPFDWRGNNKMYWFSFCYQLISMLVHSPMLSGVDALPSCLMCIVGGYYDGLNANLKVMGSNIEQDRLIFNKSIVKLANIKK